MCEAGFSEFFVILVGGGGWVGESNQEIVSFRFVSLVRAVWLPSGIRSQKWLPTFSIFLFCLFELSLFPFCLFELSLFACVSDV